jgi:hypothetical protein
MLASTTDNPQLNDRRFLKTTSTSAFPEQQILAAPLTFAVPSLPESYRARRVALGLTTARLAAVLGVTEQEIEIIESVPLGADVDFLHNLALSTLELAAPAAAARPAAGRSQWRRTAQRQPE